MAVSAYQSRRKHVLGVTMETATCAERLRMSGDPAWKRQLGNDQAQSPHTIVYIDSQSLTRECVTEQLATRLPELLVESVAQVGDLSADRVDVKQLALGILNRHSQRIREPDLADQLSALAAIAPNLPLAIFSDLDVAEEIVEALKLGIRGYIPTTLPIQQAAEAIRLVNAGGCFLPPSVLSLSIAPQSPPASESTFFEASLTPRELEVLKHLCEGKRNKLIGHDLNMCESTVKVHIRHIMKKLNASNRTQVVLLAQSIYAQGIDKASG